MLSRSYRMQCTVYELPSAPRFQSWAKTFFLTFDLPCYTWGKVPVCLISTCRRAQQVSFRSVQWQLDVIDQYPTGPLKQHHPPSIFSLLILQHNTTQHTQHPLHCLAQLWTLSKKMGEKVIIHREFFSDLSRSYSRASLSRSWSRAPRYLELPAILNTNHFPITTETSFSYPQIKCVYG